MGCWDQSWATPTSGGLTQARQRLGPEPLELLFDKVAGPVAGALTRGVFLRETYGYLLTHYAIAALICRAATEADIDPDRVKFLRTVRIVRRRAADPAFPP